MKNETKKLNHSVLLHVIVGNRRLLAIIGITALIASSIISLFIKDKYKSSVILFPTTTSSISKALISENNANKDDVLRFGEVEEAEQLLQILNSDEIKYRIIEKYNLMEHYKIREDEKYKITKLYKEFQDNITFRLTKYLAIEISVLDYSADTASFIANDIAVFLDSVKNRMQKEIAIPAFKIVEERYNNQKEFVKSLEDSLTSLRLLGVIDYESQAERLTEQLAIAVLQGKSSAITALEDRLKTLSKYGGAYVSIRDQLEYEKKLSTAIHTKYEEAKIDAETTLQHKFIVNNAFPAEKSTYPIRWLIVLVSVFSTLTLTILILIVQKNISTSK